VQSALLDPISLPFIHLSSDSQPFRKVQKYRFLFALGSMDDAAGPEIDLFLPLDIFPK
jgi:hypothetical protein